MLHLFGVGIEEGEDGLDRGRSGVHSTYSFLFRGDPGRGFSFYLVCD